MLGFLVLRFLLKIKLNNWRLSIFGGMPLANSIILRLRRGLKLANNVRVAPWSVPTRLTEHVNRYHRRESSH